MRNFTREDTQRCMLAVCSSAELSCEKVFSPRCPLLERPMALNLSLPETRTVWTVQLPPLLARVTLAAEEPRHRWMLPQTCTIALRPLGGRDTEGTRPFRLSLYYSDHHSRTPEGSSTPADREAGSPLTNRDVPTIVKAVLDSLPNQTISSDIDEPAGSTSGSLTSRHSVRS